MKKNITPNNPKEWDDDIGPLHQFSLPLSDKSLPPIMRDVVRNAPESRKVAAFVACLSPLCALATRVRLHYYYDGTRKSALLLQVIIEAPQSSGKQFAADIEKLIMKDTLKALDQQQRRKEQEYRERRRSRGANQKMEEEPKTTIRVIPATISKTVLVKRADFYQRVLGDVLTFWMFAEELAQVTDAGKQGYSNLRTIMRTAYDFDSLFGMDFASDNSYSAIVDINICSMFCTTPSALDDYMDKKAVEGGNITRTLLCQLGDELGADGAIFTPYSDEQLRSIRHWLRKMMDDVYTPEGGLRPEKTLDTTWIDRDVRKWCTRKGKEAIATGSAAIDVFRKRASVSAFRVMALCYYLYHLEADYLRDAPSENKGELKYRLLTEEQIQARCRKIYLFMADYTLTMLLGRWGSHFEQLMAKRNEGKPPTERKRLIDLMPEHFDRELLRATIAEAKLATPDRIILSQWKANKWIEQTDKNQYRKVGSIN